MNYKIKRGVLKKYKDEKGVTEIFIPDSVGIIDQGAFSGCTNLVRILVPDSVQIISDTAFSGCENLQSIALPESTVRLGWYAFRGCRSLSDLTIPSSLREIGKFAFAGCDHLAAVKVVHDDKIYRFVLRGELDNDRWQKIRNTVINHEQDIAS
ncbi:MAG: leucine-rich repeat domain-containing protein [Ruminococcus sp.]|uniref:leucine-rich repeat domain-containing protein n=1 Tax=Ruminococcus sp. TaxID=41978 RepID=UPI0025F564EB|nr:leucine-rich repeat domain-containing protein [Ruminococcus sp.]MCR5599630.1 leucine-rich repeat domain-containing protein [Ruminococcus sp.]